MPHLTHLTFKTEIQLVNYNLLVHRGRKSSEKKMYCELVESNDIWRTMKVNSPQGVSFRTSFLFSQSVKTVFLLTNYYS